MSDRDPEEQPSLELPSLSGSLRDSLGSPLGGWRRRRRGKRVAEQPVPAQEAQEPPVVHDAQEAPVAPTTAGQSTEVLPQVVAEPPPPPAEPRVRRELPRPTGLIAVVLVGAVVGLAIVGLTWAALRTCEQLQGTASCGTAGYPLLAVVVAGAVLVGSVLLRLCAVPDPVSTSFLGVGAAIVLLLLFLVDHLDQPAMVVVIPVIVAATYAAAHWLTATFTEPGERR